MDFSERMKIALGAAMGAGSVLSEIFNADMDLGLEQKSDGSPVTIADMQAEKSIVDTIKENFPDDAIIGEEGALEKGVSGYTWVINPLDGTRNFSKKIHDYAVSIGVLLNGKPNIGVVYMPEIGKTGAIYYAEEGLGAFCNSKKIAVSEKGEITGADISIDGPINNAGRESDLIAENATITTLGTIAGEMALLASGGYDGGGYLGASSWDIAAGVMLISEAGGKVTALDGTEIDWTKKSGHNIIASNALIHNKLLEIYQNKSVKKNMDDKFLNNWGPKKDLNKGLRGFMG